jgi:hypothetical protein
MVDEPIDMPGYERPRGAVARVMDHGDPGRTRSRFVSGVLFLFFHRRGNSMIRRHILSALALVALAAVVAAPAQAGGTSGAVGVKKTANVKIKNVGSTNTYVVVIPQGLAAPVTVNDAKRLGAIMRPANSGAIFYPVPSGNGVIAVIDAASVPSSGVLPPPDDAVAYSVGKGKIAYAKITTGPNVDIVPKY